MLDGPDGKNSQSVTSTEELTPWLGSQIQKTLDNIYEKYRHVDEGALATYIPELGKANPNDFGICLATAEGEVFMAGDWKKNSQFSQCANRSRSKWHWNNTALKRC